MLVRRDVLLLFLTRTVRLMAYGTVGVILALYLKAVGLSNKELGILLTLTLLGDSVISLAVTRWADQIGRRFMLISSSLLMVLAGFVYAKVLQPSFALLLVAATVGVLSPSGNEVGPFMALEQSILAEMVSPASRTHVFAWYQLVGYSMTAVGALAAGGALTWSQRVYDISELDGYRAVFLQYAASGGLLLLLFALLTDQVERPERRNGPEDQDSRKTGRRSVAFVTVTTTAAGLGTAGTTMEHDEEAGLREPLLRVPEEVETCELGLALPPPPSPLQPPSSPPLLLPITPGPSADPPAPAGAPQERGVDDDVSSTPDAVRHEIDDQAAAASAAAAAVPAATVPSVVESFPVMVDHLTEEGSEWYGSEADYLTTPPRRDTSVPPSPLTGLYTDGEGIDRTGGPGVGAGSVYDVRAMLLRISPKAKAGGGVGGAANTAAVDCCGAAGGAVGALGLSSHSQSIVLQLAALFAMDSFAGGLMTGTLLVYYFQTTYGVSAAYLGGLMFGANLLAAVSSLLSGFVAARIGLLNTMVFTHLPSNILMLLVPLMPSLRLATLVVFLRFSISQMDVAPRASYVAGVVRPQERTAAMGIVNMTKSIGAAFGPLLTGWLAEEGLFHWSFYLCGGLKIVYDLTLLWRFSRVKPEH